MVDGCGDGLLKPDIPFVSFVSQFGSASSADHGRQPVVRTQPTACLPVVVTAGSQDFDGAKGDLEQGYALRR
jgi:hypothetical protein